MWKGRRRAELRPVVLPPHPPHLITRPTPRQCPTRNDPGMTRPTRSLRRPPRCPRSRRKRARWTSRAPWTLLVRPCLYWIDEGAKEKPRTRAGSWGGMATRGEDEEVLTKTATAARVAQSLGRGGQGKQGCIAARNHTVGWQQREHALRGTRELMLTHLSSCSWNRRSTRCAVRSQDGKQLWPLRARRARGRRPRVSPIQLPLLHLPLPLLLSIPSVPRRSD
jgi:hypothetical protein